MKPVKLDFNDLLDQAGSFGLYQCLLCAFLVVPTAALSALVYFAQFFIILVPDHWCNLTAAPQQETFINLTLFDSGAAAAVTPFKDLWIPFRVNNDQFDHTVHRNYDEYNTNDVSDSKAYDSCSLYLKSNQNGLPLDKRPKNESQVLECPSGWTYDFRLLFPTIATENNWVCNNKRVPYHLQTIFYVGTSFGCLLFGFISDKFGRRASILASISLSSVCGILTIFGTNFWSLAALRFLVGSAFIPFSEDPLILSLEFMSAERRTFATVTWIFGYISAAIAAPWIFYALGDWKLICIATSLPLMIILIGSRYIPESASWLLSVGRTEEALTILDNVAKWNKRSFTCVVSDHQQNQSRENVKLNPSNEITESLKTTEEKNEDNDGDDDVQWYQIFQTPRLRVRALCLGLIWFLTYCSYHTVTQNASNLGSNLYISFTLGAAVEIPAAIFILFALEKFGRKCPLVGFTVALFIAGSITPLIPKTSTSLLLIGLTFRILLATIYDIIIQYSAEVFPTVLRGRATAFLRFMGTLGLYLSPSIVYFALDNAYLPFLIIGSMSLIMAIAALFLPETLNEPVPHSVNEGERFGQQQPLCYFPCLRRESM